MDFILTSILLFGYFAGVHTGQVEECVTIKCGQFRQAVIECYIKVEGPYQVINVTIIERPTGCYCNDRVNTTSYGVNHNKSGIYVFQQCCGNFRVCYTRDGVKRTEDTAEVASTTWDTKRYHETAARTRTTFGHSNADIDSTPSIKENTRSVEFDDRTKRVDGARHINEKTTLNPSYMIQDNLNETDKYFLIVGIVAGGLILIVLIAGISYYCVTSQDKPKEKLNKSPRKILSQRFRDRPTLSTSGLILSEVVSSNPVYDVIPIDQVLSESLDVNTLKQNNITPTLLETYETNETGVEELKEHTYFKLLPETCRFCHTIPQQDNNVGVYSHQQTKGTYDQLQTFTPQALPNSSEYSHLKLSKVDQANIYDEITSPELRKYPTFKVEYGITENKW